MCVCVCGIFLPLHKQAFLRMDLRTVLPALETRSAHPVLALASAACWGHLPAPNLVKHKFGQMK